MIDMDLMPAVRSGYAAARKGVLYGANPWKPDTVGALAWAFGHNMGTFPAPLRWAFAAILWARS